MTTQQDRYDQMQIKLQKGLRGLSEDTPKDPEALGMALIRLHGALEDFIRLEVAQKKPDLAHIVEDVNQTTWRDLIGYGKQYLGFTENDARLISKFNRIRLNAAHGDEFALSLDDLKEYAEYVQKWCNRVQATQKLTAPRQEQHSVPYYPEPRNRSLSGFAKLIIYSIVIMLFCFVVGLIGFNSIMSAAYRQLPSSTNNPQNILLLTPTQSNSSSRISTNTPFAADSPFGTQTSCNIVWEEYVQSSSLAGKNRADVWVEIVMAEVDGSGMTFQEFSDLVVEQNPELAADGYEFKEKTYILPKCKS